MTTEKPIVERVIDRAKQALSDMGSLEVISLQEREEILSAVSDIQEWIMRNVKKRKERLLN